MADMVILKPKLSSLGKQQPKLIFCLGDAQRK